ncbi:hypothetical protein N0V83_004343 [Neocucurbitaria cava]|uniref:Uncharacterized protein n=1 Tax=Neocucurbitaria cava TaxID=798079 RepID=A0A9W8Y912_9PLEO|nr:hypothetical protein N0V83_004343 [Neocucurbitaria cava]
MPADVFPPVIIDTRVTYRIGSPLLPAQPVHTIWRLSIAEWWKDGFRQEVDKILREDNVYVKQLGVVKRVQRGNDAQTIPKTILIVSDISVPDQRENWKRATSNLRALLRSRGRDELFIEIIDAKAVFGITSAAIGDDDSATVTAWKNMSRQFLEEVSDRDWLTIDVVHRKVGEHVPKKIPTICITASDALDAVWWDETIPRLRDVASPNFEIDLFYATHVLNTMDEHERIEDEDEGSEIFATIESYRNDVQMGASIGVDNSNTSGTVSACVELCTPKGEKIMCALTNHHVAATSDELANECPVGQYLDPNHRLAREQVVRIMSPSDKDHERLKSWNSMQVRDLELVEQMRKERGKDCNVIDKRLLAARNDATKLGQDGGVSPDRYLGAVWASSGHRTAPNTTYTTEQARRWSRIRNTNETCQHTNIRNQEASLAELINGSTLEWGLNWALIKVQAPRSLSSDVPASGSRVHIPEGALCTRYGDIQPERCYSVAKLGRTTGWTTGEVNQIESLVHLRYDNTSVVPIDLRKRFGKIVLAYAIVSDVEQKDFIAGGDSGSVVLLNERNPEATMLGLGFASNKATFVGYMLPMSHIIEDIERVTSSKVTMPERVAMASGDFILDDP